MIFNFKDDLLFTKILNILKQIACENELITYRNLKRLLTVKHFLQLYRVPRLQCQTLLIMQYQNILRTIDVCSSLAKAHFLINEIQNLKKFH